VSAGADREARHPAIRTVQELPGHENVETATIYTHVLGRGEARGTHRTGCRARLARQSNANVDRLLTKQTITE